MESVGCPGCAGETWESWRQTSAGTRFVRCPRCSMGRIDPMLTAEELAETFDDGYFQDGGARGGYQNYDADAAVHLSNARSRIQRIDRVRTPVSGVRPLLVDVGCASGYTLEAARDGGWQAAGVEVSPQAADRARSKGFRVERALTDLLEGPDSLAGQAQAVSFFQVLEHLRDPGQALELAAELLAPGGLLICETWDPGSRVAQMAGDRWQQLSPSVLWVFPHEAMERMTAAHAMRLQRWAPSTKWVSVGLVTGQVMPRLQSTPAVVRNTAKAVLDPVSRVRVPYGLGDLVTAVAIKQA